LKKNIREITTNVWTISHVIIKVVGGEDNQYCFGRLTFRIPHDGYSTFENRFR